jgi:LytS/YehU family sensor histidine kinase
MAAGHSSQITTGRSPLAKNGFMDAENKSYWACQIAGWAAYSFGVGMTIGVLEVGWRPTVIIGYLLFFCYSIGLTHLLRATIRRRGWASLPMPRALLPLASAGILVVVIQCALVIGVYWAVEGQLGVWREWNSVIPMFLGLSVICAMWITLYLTITGMRHSREAKRKEMEMKLIVGKAELRALEAQLNPHFLFNCLNSIRGMIVENPPQAQDMVTRLANILRYSLQKDRRDTVPLASEVEVVSDYLALESVRYDDRLRIHLEVAQEAAHSQIPPMLLQTLVENAIKHGIEEYQSGGELFIRARVDGDILRIEVENPGSLNEPRPDSTQIGLSNARERLRIIYGNRASLQLATPLAGRVTATLLIPSVA